jgi:hypothetical protein
MIKYRDELTFKGNYNKPNIKEVILPSLCNEVHERTSVFQNILILACSSFRTACEVHAYLSLYQIIASHVTHRQNPPPFPYMGLYHGLDKELKVWKVIPEPSFHISIILPLWREIYIIGIVTWILSLLCVPKKE